MAELLPAVGVLNEILNARSIALVGASNDPRKFAYALFDTLRRGGYSGHIYPVNPREKSIQGVEAYASVRAVPGPLDAALVIVPAPAVPQVLVEAAGKGVRGAVIYSAGYGEGGHPEREAELRAIVAQYGIRLVGPNIQGLIYVPNNLSAMFWPAVTTQGPVAIISQSGSVAAGLAEWAVSDGLGISAAFNLGNQVDLCDSDMLEFCGQDPHTRAIMMYLEGVKDGRRFLETLERVAREKPVAILKAGRTPSGRRSAASHTGALAGSDEVFSGACRQFGVVRAEDMESLYDAGKALAMLRAPRGRRLMVVSSSGGGNTLSVDEAERRGLQIPPLPPALVEKLQGIGLPPNANLSNPLDLAGVTAAHFERAVALADALDVADVYLLAFCDPVPGSTELVRRLSPVARAGLAVTYFGGGQIERESRLEIQAAGVPVFAAPERAVRAVATTMWAADYRRAGRQAAFGDCPRQGAGRLQ